jgi:3-hydroxyacyl-CoA dehydrogenase / enoyl-CoA hydratase / 3-hydroxybutyryl-CoA epimerase
MGPMRLLDEVGIDVALHVAQTIAANYGDRMHLPELLSKMAQAGLLGKKSGRGFYLHAKGKESVANPGAIALSSRNPQPATRRTDLQERMVLLMVNEAARCLEEEIVPDPADVDFAMIMGTGFAPFRGGPLRYADSVGITNIVASMSRLVDSGATHFAPCGLLRDLAAIGKFFYKS